MKRLLVLGVLAALVACSPKQEAAKGPTTQVQEPAVTAPAEEPVDVPAGAYTIDPGHTSILFRVDHLGFSNYTARFKKAAAQLQFDPNNLAASSVTVTVDTQSLETDYDTKVYDFNGMLLGEEWLSAAKHPEITFRSISVEPTGPRTMRINGELTLRGVTRPMVLDAKFNGGYRGHPMDPNARIGFSATGVLNRSEFGLTAGIPAPGTKMGVSDAVNVIVETEFSGPPLNAAAAQASQPK